MPSVESIAGGNADERAFRMISGAVQRAQDLAVTTRLPQTIVIELDRKTLGIGESPTASLPEKTKIAIRTERDGRDIVSGRAEIRVDRYGAIEPFSIRVGDFIHANANPITGVLER